MFRHGSARCAAASGRYQQNNRSQSDPRRTGRRPHDECGGCPKAVPRRGCPSSRHETRRATTPVSRQTLTAQPTNPAHARPQAFCAHPNRNSAPAKPRALRSVRPNTNARIHPRPNPDTSSLRRVRLAHQIALFCKTSHRPCDSRKTTTAIGIVCFTPFAVEVGR
jgi:hypothetical protein